MVDATRQTRLRRRAIMGKRRRLGKVGLAILYRRKLGLQTVFVALNLGSKLEFIEVESFTGTILLSTHCDRANEKCQGRIDLRPDEGLVILSKLRC